MDTDDRFEVDLISAAPEASQQELQPVARSGRLVPLVAVVVAGVVALFTFGGDAEPGAGPESPVTEPADLPGAMAQTAEAEPAEGDEADYYPGVGADTARRQPFPALRLRPAASTLPGQLVVAPDPHEDISMGVVGGVAAPETGEGLWVIEHGRAIARFDFPALTRVFVASNGLVYSDGVETMVMSPDTAAVQGIDLELEPDVLWAGAGPRDVWAVQEWPGFKSAVERITIDDGGVQNTPAPVGLEPGTSIAGGVADGLLVSDLGVLHGHWTPDTGTTALDSVGHEMLRYVVLGTSGNLIVLAEDEQRRLAVIDVTTDTRFAELPTDGIAAGACFSPNGRYLAVRYHRFADRTEIGMTERVSLATGGERPPSDDRVSVFDLDDRARFPVTYDLGEPVADITWAADDELVVVLPGRLLAVTLTDDEPQAPRPIADLAGAGRWSIASAADTC